MIITKLILLDINRKLSGKPLNLTKIINDIPLDEQSNNTDKAIITIKAANNRAGIFETISKTDRSDRNNINEKSLRQSLIPLNLTNSLSSKVLNTDNSTPKNPIKLNKKLVKVKLKKVKQSKPLKKKAKMTKFKALSMIIYTYFVIKKRTKGKNKELRANSLKKFVYYLNNEYIEDIIGNWLYTSIRIPYLSIIRSIQMDFDISSNKVKNNSYENELKYIKLEVWI